MKGWVSSAATGRLVLVGLGSVVPFAAGFTGCERGRNLEPGGDRESVAALIRADRLDEAEQEIDRWLARAPDDIGAHLARAEWLARSGGRADAIDVLESLAPRADDPSSVWLRAATLHERAGEFEGAVRCARAAVDARPDDDARVRLGDLLRIAGRLDDAEAVLAPIATRSEAPFAARHALAAVRSGQGRFAEVVRLIEPSLGDPGLPTNAREHYAVALEGLDRPVDAARQWVAVLEREPHRPEITYRFARVAQRLGDRRLAAAMFARFDQLSDLRDGLDTAAKHERAGRDALASIERARAWASIHEVGLAAKHYLLAVRTPSVGVNDVIDATLWLIQRDLLAEAAEVISIASARQSLPRHVTASMEGLLFEREGRLDDAARSFERALTADSGYAPARESLLRVGAASPREGAIAALRGVLRAQESPARSLGYVRLGRLAQESGREDLARDYASAAVWTDPESTEALEFTLAAWSRPEERFVRLWALARLCELRPEDPELARQRATERKSIELSDRAPSR